MYEGNIYRCRVCLDDTVFVCFRLMRPRYHRSHRRRKRRRGRRLAIQKRGEPHLGRGDHVKTEAVPKLGDVINKMATRTVSALPKDLISIPQETS